MSLSLPFHFFFTPLPFLCHIMKAEQKVILEDFVEIRVKFSEIDSMRRAWHGSYVTYMEDGRESFGLHYPGIGYADITASGIYAPIVDIHVKYYGPLELNDIVVIRTRYVYHPGARLDYNYEMRRKSDGALCCRATTTQLFIDPEGKLLTDKPQYYEDWQKKYGVIE